MMYSKTCLKQPLKKNTKSWFSIPIIGQCLTFIKLSFVIKTFVLSIFKWPLKTGFTVHVEANFSKFVLMLCPSFSQQFFSQVGTFPGLNQSLAEDEISCLRTLCSASSETRTSILSDPEPITLTLSHRASYFSR